MNHPHLVLHAQTMIQAKKTRLHVQLKKASGLEPFTFTFIGRVGEMSRENQRDSNHVSANVPELQPIRHEFGHVLQFLLWRHMAENEPEYKDQ